MSRAIKNIANAIAEVLEVPSSLFANIFTIANESADKLRWVCIAPYGDWPNPQGLQRVQKDDAVQVVNEFNSILNTPQRILGLPWYIGHPDHPSFKERYKDTKAYGRIKRLEARGDGIYAGVKFGGDGEKLIADEAFDGHSVNWFLKQDQQNKRVWRPFRLKSVGWTNEPNIPVPTLTSANEDANGGINVEFANGVELQKAHWQKLANLRLMGNAWYGDPEGHAEAARGGSGGGGGGDHVKSEEMGDGETARTGYKSKEEAESHAAELNKSNPEQTHKAVHASDGSSVHSYNKKVEEPRMFTKHGTPMPPPTQAARTARARSIRSPKPNHDFSSDAWTEKAKEGQRVKANPKVQGGGKNYTIESFGKDKLFVVVKDAEGKSRSFNASDLSPND